MVFSSCSIWEIPEWYPWESDSKSRTCYTIKLNKYVIEDYIYRKYSHKYPCTRSNLSCSSQKLKIYLYKKIETEKEWWIGKDDSWCSKFFWKKYCCKVFAHLKHKKWYPYSNYTEIERKFSTKHTHFYCIISRIELRYNREEKGYNRTNKHEWNIHEWKVIRIISGCFSPENIDNHLHIYLWKHHSDIAR